MIKDPILRVEDLSTHFPIYQGWFRKLKGYVQAVTDVSFSIELGQTVALVGESGSGKSSLARTIMRAIPATQGKIILDGKDITTLSHHKMKPLRKKIQIVFQNPTQALNPRKTVEEAITEPILIHELYSTKKEAIDACTQLLEQVGLYSDVALRYPHELSLGQQQRVAIARALALNPQLILLDEAVSALDASIQAQVLNLLQDIKRQRHIGYLFISHDLHVVRHISDKVMVMYLGKMIEWGNTLDVLNAPQHPYTKALIGSLPKNHPQERSVYKEALVGPVADALNIPSGCPLHPRCPYKQNICVEQFPTQKILKGHYSKMFDHAYRCILGD